MEETILNAIERVKQSGKFKEKGFVPGVLYGDSIAVAKPVKFRAAALNETLTRHGSNAKVEINYNDSVKSGFIKEVQRNAISGAITHVDVQIVSKDQQIKLRIPVIFKGEDVLGLKQLQLQVYKADVSVLGMMNLMPDALYVDVSNMKLDDSITVRNFDLDKQIKVNEKEDAVYGVIINHPSNEIDLAESE